MEREKLTLADCFKYPNARIREINTDYSWRGILRFLADTMDIEFSVVSCKLILRSIDELTEEEKDIIDNITMYDKELLELGTIVNYRRYSIAVMDYLRSINIDIDGFTENGKAVKQ